MLRSSLLGAFWVLCSLTFAQNIGISTNGATPDPEAILDVDVTSLPVKRGLLVPRMTEAQRLAIPVAAADNALLVYQTDLGAAMDTSNARGFWYYDATATMWRHLSSARRGWSLTGNNVAFAGGNLEYIGTDNSSTNRNLVIRSVPPPANPTMYMAYNVMAWDQGLVSLGTPAPPTERLEVEGAIRMAMNGAPAADVASPREGSIRYGTFDGVTPPSITEHKFHWGALDSAGTIYWARLENADSLVTPPKPFAKDTLTCQGQNGLASLGEPSATPVTDFSGAPFNYYSPFATNGGSTGSGMTYRVQYLYRNQELRDAGLCFPATINSISFFCLDDETLNPNCQINGEIRGGAPVEAGLTGAGASFGGNHTYPFMSDAVRTKPVNGSIFNFLASSGWITFNLTTPITLGVADNLIIDIVWYRGVTVGVGPRVELMQPGFNCTKWVGETISTMTTPGQRALFDDSNGGSGIPAPPPTTNMVVAPTANNAHGKRPVTRFGGEVRTPDVITGHGNYILYNGGIQIGDPVWAAANYKGPGTIRAQNGLYDGTLLLSDHVFDTYFDGATRPQDEQAALGYAYVGLPELREQLERDRHLPNMPSRQYWEASSGASLGKLATGLWQTVEDQAIYISQLEKDLAALEQMSFGNGLSPQEADQLTADVKASRRLTPAQKIHLLEIIGRKTTPNTLAR